jgi:hypothetical protein
MPLVDQRRSCVIAVVRSRQDHADLNPAIPPGAYLNSLGLTVIFLLADWPINRILPQQGFRLSSHLET